MHKKKISKNSALVNLVTKVIMFMKSVLLGSKASQFMELGINQAVIQLQKVLFLILPVITGQQQLILTRVTS